VPLRARFDSWSGRAEALAATITLNGASCSRIPRLGDSSRAAASLAIKLQFPLPVVLSQDFFCDSINYALRQSFLDQAAHLPPPESIHPVLMSKHALFQTAQRLIHQLSRSLEK
jgi:hypothetical protein